MRKESELSQFENGQIRGVRAVRARGGARAEGESNEDQVLQALLDKFLVVAFLMDQEEQASFVRLYTKHIAGVEIPEEWWKQDDLTRLPWLDQIGRNLNSVEAPLDGKAFWQEVNGTFPKLLSETELEWLIQHDPRGEGGFHLLCNMWFLVPRSYLVSLVGNSIHVWK